MCKHDFGCGRPECGASSTIMEDPSFGTGELDNLGFWEYGCYKCARAYKKAVPGAKAWPYEEDDQHSSDLRKKINGLLFEKKESK